MKLHNTLSGKKEEFRASDGATVRMYVCGPTVYSSSHLGHARPAVVFDTLRRYLEFSGHTVKLVTNFTDIDDKIIRRAKDEGSTEREISQKYINEYFEDMDALNVGRADIYPKATEHVQEMIDLVQKLLDNGYAYRVGEADVFFRVHKFSGYGRLSGRTPDQVKEARIEPDERKENAEDFALWKAARPDEPSWETPWGKGRPGWHIECSAMSGKYLAPLPFDIHGGGQDLVFPHHENEIAQTEAAFGKPMARFWLHNGFININREKMSKSLGNVFNLRAAYESYPPAALRLFLLGTHYRTDISYTPERLKEATAGLERILDALEKAEKLGDRELNDEAEQEYESAMKHFGESMDDDLNTAAALGVLYGSIHETNLALQSGQDQAELNAIAHAKAAGAMLKVLGLPTRRSDNMLKTRSEAGAQAAAPDEALLNALGEARALARTEKAFAVSDFIRERLIELGYEIRDLPDGKFEIKRRL
ncbi:MAG: cysteine--tRNA ligase [Planctomycetes bacterium]|nr:cysteine--tRNA ligase [Planctomycetota bacterium]